MLGTNASSLVGDLKSLLITDPRIAHAVVSALGRIGAAAKPAVPELARIHAESQDWNLRLWSALAAFRINGERWARDYIVDQLRREVALEREPRALRALSRYFEPRQADFALPEVTAALDASDYDVVHFACLAIGRMGTIPDEAVEKLHRRMTRDPDINIARDLLTLHPDDEMALSFLINRLGATDSPVEVQWGPVVNPASSRWFVISALGLAGPPARPALPQLRLLLHDHNAEIRKLAALAIKRIESGR